MKTSASQLKVKELHKSKLHYDKIRLIIDNLKIKLE